MNLSALFAPGSEANIFVIAWLLISDMHVFRKNWKNQKNHPE